MGSAGSPIGRIHLSCDLDRLTKWSNTFVMWPGQAHQLVEYICRVTWTGSPIHLSCDLGRLTNWSNTFVMWPGQAHQLVEYIMSCDLGRLTNWSNTFEEKFWPLVELRCVFRVLLHRHANWPHPSSTVVSVRVSEGLHHYYIINKPPQISYSLVLVQWMLRRVFHFHKFISVSLDLIWSSWFLQWTSLSLSFTLTYDLVQCALIYT